MFRLTLINRQIIFSGYILRRMLTRRESVSSRTENRRAFNTTAIATTQLKRVCKGALLLCWSPEAGASGIKENIKLPS